MSRGLKKWHSEHGADHASMKTIVQTLRFHIQNQASMVTHRKLFRVSWLVK